MSAAAVIAAALLALHNHARAQHHLPPLRLDPLLTAAATMKAADIRRCKTFAHDPCGYGVWVYFPDFRAALAENIAEGFLYPVNVARAWLASPGHRANILNPALRRVGFAHAGRFWVAEFTS